MGATVELNKDNFDDFIKEDNVIIDFHAEWCGPCQMLGPVLEEVAKEVKGTVKIGKVDIDNNSDLAQRFQVMSIPAMIFFKDKEQIHRLQGALDKDGLMKVIEDQF
tara:strand:- start:215 stop:532 length:318 start_codon:yes stop_codon:yes gene_type:complete